MPDHVSFRRSSHRRWGFARFPSLPPVVKNSRRSLAALVSAFVIAACGKDSTSPLVATQLVFTVQPSSTMIDSAIVPAIAVTVEDAAGNVVTTGNQLITIALAANPGNANLSGTARLAAVGGVATFPYMALNRAGNGYTLTASAENLPTVTSGAFNITSVTSGAFTQISASGPTTCSVAVGGKAYCWGAGNLGQLGNGGTGRFATPSAVAGALTFSSAASGGLDSFSCGLTTGGAAYCWGYNSAGQLGVGSISFSSAPVAVSGGLSFAQLSAGESGETCGITTSGAAYCWGFNGDGELGNGTVTSSNAPVAVSGGLTFKSISAGFASTCALTTAGAAYCWGDNTYGELGNGSTTKSTVPVAVSGLGSGVRSVSAGISHALALLNDGTVKAWGANEDGQLGIGNDSGPETCSFSEP